MACHAINESSGASAASAAKISRASGAFAAVFSNAALHWMPRVDDVVAGVARALTRPGRFVAELGGTGNTGIPIQNASGNDAIVIGLDYNANATGRSCFMTESFPDPEVNYVEQTVSTIEGQFCVDKSRLFIEGFSSGSWLSYLMGCVDGGPGGLFKAQGNASGEDQGWNGTKDSFTCKGPTPWMAGHNNPDGNNAYSAANGSIVDNTGHNPFLTSLTFSLTVSGVTSSSVIQNVFFSFGTKGGDNNHPGNLVPTPEPRFVTLLSFGVVVLAFVARRRRLEKN